MIISQTRKRRTFVGSLNPGSDVLGSLTSICVDKTIFCGVVSAVGYLRGPRLRNWDPERRTYGPATQHEGVLHLVSCQGNISLDRHQTDIRLHVMGQLTTPAGAMSVVSGELVAAEVLTCEFTLETRDDMRLYRARDDRTGLETWLHMELGSGPLISDEASEPVPTVRATRNTQPPAPPAASQQRVALSPADIVAGDRLHHPTLGACQVVETDGDERATIRLESGRLVELHLGLLDFTPVAATDGGPRLVRVSIKRRR